MSQAGDSMKRAIICGAAGTIGISLTKFLAKNRIPVTVILNPASERNQAVPDSEYIKKVYCSLSEIENLEPLDCRGGVFFHLSWMGTTGEARNDEALQRNNCMYTMDAVRLASLSDCRKFVGIGSQAEYGRSSTPLSSATPCNPENMYGKYKLLAGEKAKELCKELKLEFNWVRAVSVFGNTYGERSLPAYAISCFERGINPEYTSAEQVIDFLYCKDSARALSLIADKGINGKTYVLSSGTGKPLKEYIKDLHKVFKPELEPQFGALPYAANQNIYMVGDISELTADTGFMPEFSFEEALKDIKKEREEF